MTEPAPAQILSLTPRTQPTPQAKPKSSTGWTIFWLIGFTPVGWYFVWRKTSWPTWIKVAVTILTLLAVVGLLIETELIAGQVSSLGSDLSF